MKIKIGAEALSFMKYKLRYYYNIVRAMRVSITVLGIATSLIGFSTNQHNASSFAIGAGILMVFNLASSTFILRQKKPYLPVMTYIVLTMSATLIFSLEMMHESLEKDSKISMLSYGIMIGLLCSFVLLSRMPWYFSLVIFLNFYVYWELRLGGFELHLENRIASSFALSSVLLSITYVFYKQDNIELADFNELQKNQKGLLYFKNLIKEVMPNQILILNVENKTESTLLFANEAAKKLFNSDRSCGINSSFERFSLVHTKLEEELEIQSAQKRPESFLHLLYLNKKSLSLNNFSHFQADYLEAKNISMELDNLTRFQNLRFEISVGIIEWDGIENAMILIFNDVSKTKKITELEVLHRKKDDLLAAVSHSLRTPLNGITGMIEITKERVVSKADRKNLNIAMNSATTLKLFINDLLDMSKIKKKNFTLNFNIENLWDILKGVIKLVKYQVKEKGLELIFQFDIEKSFSLHIDKSRLQQIVLNLLSNAIKYTDQGLIKLHVFSKTIVPQLCKSPEIFSATLRKDSESEIIISVSDTGCGMREEQFSQIFQLFDNIKSQGNLTGIGMGLSISQRLARAINPRNEQGIQFESQLGIGSRFWFSIPFVEHQTAPSNQSFDEGERAPLIMKNFHETFIRTFDEGLFKPPKQIKEEIQPQRRVIELTGLKALLVDDEPVNLLVLCKYMESMSIQNYQKAQNGLIAIELIESAARNDSYFDFVLMDCNMPVMDGHEASRLIKKMVDEKKIKPLKVIAVTANVTESDKRKCLENGMDYVFTKPLIKNEFIAELKKLLD